MATLAAWQRFVANAPESQREYRTIEVWHPQLSQVYRFVANSIDVNFKLEDDAPRHPGLWRPFTAATLTITEPMESEDATQALLVSFGNVDGLIHTIVDQVSGVGFFDPVQIVYRKYYSGDKTVPAVPPLYLFASGLGFDGPNSVAFNAEDTDLAQKRSGSTYIVEQFPGLQE